MTSKVLSFRSAGLVAACLGGLLMAGCSNYPGTKDTTMGASGSVPITTPISEVRRPVGGTPRQTAYPPAGAYGPGTVMPSGTVGPSGGSSGATQ